MNPFQAALMRAIARRQLELEAAANDDDEDEDVDVWLCYFKGSN